MPENIDDYIERGMHGQKEMKAEEKQKYLSALRERVILALTKGQVMKASVYEPAAGLMKQYSGCRLILNGEISYSYLSKYIKMATKNGVPFTIYDHLKTETDIGLVLASDKAVDLEDIEVNNF